jgi:integrase/recombinase XerD
MRRCSPPRRRARQLPGQGPQAAHHAAHQADGHSPARWLAERAGHLDEPLFPTRSGRALSRDAIEHRLARHPATANAACPSLQAKKITPHVLRHTAAMRLLHAGVDTSVIVLWLGHEQSRPPRSTSTPTWHSKEAALARTTPPNTPPGRYRPPDALLAFLEAI